MIQCVHFGISGSVEAITCSCKGSMVVTLASHDVYNSRTDRRTTKHHILNFLKPMCFDVQRVKDICQNVKIFLTLHEN